MNTAVPTSQTSRGRGNPLVRYLLKPLASLQFTVVLFALSMVLVFFGTVAMTDKGLWTVVDEYFRSFVVAIPIDLVRKFCVVFLAEVGNFPKDATPWPGKIPFPAGWTIGFLMLINLLAAHLIRFKLSWRRSGIILLHAGVVLLMVGELVTGLFAVESTMTIKKGETTDFLDVTREFEIAVVDSSNPDHDRVTVVPQSKLMRPGVVSHPDLPFDLRVEEYWKNTDKEDLTAAEMVQPGVSADPNVLSISSIAPMIKGARLSKRNEAAGVDSDARSDIPTVRVTALDKGTGKELGTHLLSLWGYQNFEQNRRVYDFGEVTVRAGDARYTMSLRNRRVYVPYTVQLLDFKHGLYPGTEIHKDFASEVRVTEKQSGDAREVRIWMNNPLRYADVSMYQHAVMYNDSGTVLQVVKNPGRLLPYLSCGMIVAGMLLHFGISLMRWLSKPNAVAVPGSAAIPTARTRPYHWVVNGLIVLACVTWFGSNLRTPKPSEKGIDWYQFGKLPVRDGGRVMPLDTLARTSLQSLSELTEVKKLVGTEVKPSVSAIQWLADVLDSPDWRTGPAAKHQVFRIEHHQVLAKLDLPPRPGFFRYSMDEIRPNLRGLFAEHNRVRQKKADQKALDLYDSKVEDLAQKVALYQRLAQPREIQLLPPTAAADWSALTVTDQKAIRTLTDETKERIRDRTDAVKARMTDRFLADKKEEFAELQKKYGDPDKLPDEVMARLIADRNWLRDEIDYAQNVVVLEELRPLRGILIADSVTAGVSIVGPVARSFVQYTDTPAIAFTAMLDAARGGDGGAFQTALAKYRSAHLTSVPPGELKRVSVEAYWLDHVAPFYYAEWFYGIAAALALIGWLVWRPLNTAALSVMLLTFTLHTFALGLRIWISGRPPVTNLYASAVFIGWGCVLLCLILEVVYRNGVANLVGGVIGLATCKVAYFLGGSGDTMKMLVAVLDTNFWLTVHVLTVTAGYMGTFLAGKIASLYLLFRAIVSVSNRVRTDHQIDLSKHAYLPKMTYAVLCFALLLSFFGTVSGGIWADYSWGRFWGWDPKENGAVLIVIWNALILHARWCGLVKDRGVAVLAVAGNMVTAWSWFGTNQLQIGLHSYGFDNRLANGCFWYWVSQLGIMLLALVPSPQVAPLSPTPRAKRV